jgi:hypothetical protein
VQKSGCRCTMGAHGDGNIGCREIDKMEGIRIEEKDQEVLLCARILNTVSHVYRKTSKAKLYFPKRSQIPTTRLEQLQQLTYNSS